MSSIELRDKYVRKINKKISQVADGIVILSKIDKKLKIKNLRGGGLESVPDNVLLGETEVKLDGLRDAVETSTKYVWIEETQWERLNSTITALLDNNKLSANASEPQKIQQLQTNINTLQTHINTLTKVITDKYNTQTQNNEITDLLSRLDALKTTVSPDVVSDAAQTKGNPSVVVDASQSNNGNDNGGD
jgi:hypothetical protein